MVGQAGSNRSCQIRIVVAMAPPAAAAPATAGGSRPAPRAATAAATRCICLGKAGSQGSH